jgi:hypothetical protein
MTRNKERTICSSTQVGPLGLTNELARVSQWRIYNGAKNRPAYTKLGYTLIGPFVTLALMALGASTLLTLVEIPVLYYYAAERPLKLRQGETKQENREGIPDGQHSGVEALSALISNDPKP